jgi:hypothetical protein
VNEKDLRPELTRLATSLGAELRWVAVPSAPRYRYIDQLDVVVSGVNVVIRARTGSKGALLGATFTIEVTTPLVAAPVTMRRENALDRFGKNLFINREFQFGDAAFDAAVYIESDATDASLRNLLNAPPVRVAIANLVSGVAEHVAFATRDPNATTVDADRVQRSISVALPVSKFEQRDAILALLQTLVELGRAVERENRPAPLEPAPHGGGWRVVAALVLALSSWLATWAFAVFFTGPATIGWRAYQRGTSAGVACWIGVVALSIALFRGRSTSFRVVVTLAVLWLGLVPLTGSIAQRLNARWDRGPLTSLAGTAHVTYGSKGGPHKRVTVPSLGSEIIVPSDIVSVELSTQPSPVHVIVGEGAFGSKWISTVER